jgi:hypothetical protein
MMMRKKILMTIMIATLAAVSLTPQARAQMADRDEALTVAENWIRLIIDKKGSWGGSPGAEIAEIREFQRGGRTIGYFCQVKPQGHIIVSLRRELAPIKAYSAVCDLDPESNRGLVDLVKGKMERIVDQVELRYGPLPQVQSDDLERLLEIDYRRSWEELESGDLDIQMNYQEGDILLDTNWHQGDPYNVLCPTGDTGCTDCCPADPWTCTPTLPSLVGCVATAGAQIMRHWCWPPFGSANNSYTWDGDDSCNGPVGGGMLSVIIQDIYDWANMANEYDWDAGQSRWEDENGDPLTAAHLDAVQELCYEVGVAVEMDYGVCGSGVPTSSMIGVYENHYRYSTNCVRRNRNSYTAVDWFERMKSQFNANRPIQYRVEGHSIVADGWQETGAGPLREYHMNYGWADGNTTWWTLDALLFGGVDEEYMLENIYPDCALGSSLSGTYSTPSFPYRYFNRDATGASAVFNTGHRLQFLPGITVRCTSTTGGRIEFKGSSSSNSHLFSRGDLSKGMRIRSGHVYLFQNGSIKFH